MAKKKRETGTDRPVIEAKLTVPEPKTAVQRPNSAGEAASVNSISLPVAPDRRVRWLERVRQVKEKREEGRPTSAAGYLGPN